MAIAAKPGAKVSIMGVDGRLHRGSLLEWNSDAVTIRAAEERVELAHDSIAIIRAAGPLGDYHTIYAPWTNLRSLSRGQRIRVVRTNWSQVNGTFEESQVGGVTLLRHGKPLFVPRAKIRKVRILVKSNAEKGFQVGASVGFVATLAMAASQGETSGSPDLILEGQTRLRST
jgi:hypothetical protein